MEETIVKRIQHFYCRKGLRFGSVKVPRIRGVTECHDEELKNATASKSARACEYGTDKQTEDFPPRTSQHIRI